MNLDNLKKKYKNSPSIIKKLYSIIPWKYRMGSHYRHTLKFLNKSKDWSKEEWRNYQEKKLRELTTYCNNYVPYYKRLFANIKLDLNSNNIISELEKIPFISKKDIVENIEDFISEEYNINKYYSATTGGTTGKPTKIFYDNKSFNAEWAYKMFFWNESIGYSIKNRKATFRGVDVDDRVFVNNPIYNEIRFSPFKITEKYSVQIINKLIKYQPEFIHGYPSAIEGLVKILMENNIKLKGIKGVMLISENIFDHQKQLIEKYFNLKPYSFYGHSERLTFASMLDDLENYYVHPAYGYIELIDSEANIIKNDEIQGEIVGTGFINKAMPLLRFRTADFAEYCNNENIKNEFPLIKNIRGRWSQEFLFGKNGEKISLTALNMHSNVYNEVKELQFYQDQKGIVLLNLVGAPSFNKDAEKKIHLALMKKLGEGFELKFNYLKELEKTKSGKSKYLVQNLAE